MTKITAHIGKELYKTQIRSGNNTIIADEPKEAGGQDSGLAPRDLLASSLGACTAITLRMYANRKGWDLTDAKVEVTLQWDEEKSKTVLTRKVALFGTLDDTQRESLLKIANKCPLHKMLSNPIEIETSLG
ncbi:OsmC family protein [Flavobacterium humi]|uniref:OsmC family peroxiredoxin n=1 Tax=Flavobacterium humi TaxID=2562683 RepID=A0A4Z0LCT0_9FLAO|nr:OsmC family protein [Flavobacterium humi]TGD59712.1 OsmC family peroxiredoxin [Flavobacterium humi]